MLISALYLYPIKSLGGIAVSEAVVEEKGFRYDRRFMLVSPARTTGTWQFMTQRTNQHMALIDVAIVPSSGLGGSIRVWHRHHPKDVLEWPLLPVGAERLSATLWHDQTVVSGAVSAEADRWFSNALQTPCRLVYMPPTTRRDVDPTYARRDEQGHQSAVSFADGYPYLLIGQASLDDLNQRLPADTAAMEMLRFRPNIVVSGGLPYEEDTWSQFQIGGLNFYGVKPCARCVMTTIDPATGHRGKEPLRTLTTYRQWNHKILFGQNVLPDWRATGPLRIGQRVEVVARTEPWLSPP